MLELTAAQTLIALPKAGVIAEADKLIRAGKSTPALPKPSKQIIMTL